MRAVAKSPDGSRVYIGGDFTSVNGQGRNRIAAFDTATGALVGNFAPSVGSTVNAITATGSTVYFGGKFTSVSGQGRNRLAAVNASGGGVLAWNPGADYNVNAMVLTPDNSRVIVGGAFQVAAGQPSYGLAAVNASSGAHMDWAAEATVRDAGTNAAILGLSTDGTSIFGNGYVFGSGGNFEGTFSAEPNTGTIRWMEDCHGDTYANFAVNNIVYTVGHAHYCGNIGGYGESNPRGTYMRNAVAFTNQATGTINPDPRGYPNWANQPSPSMINWFPTWTNGSFTGQNQAGWTVTGTPEYVVVGGEFPTVNGSGQQGLVRFGVPSKAPNDRGPQVTGGNFAPTLTALAPGTVRVAVRANYDQDDSTLHYRVVRDSVTTVYEADVASGFWNRPNVGFTDTGLVAGTTYRYRVFATDSSGNEVGGDTVSIVAPGSGSPFVGYAKSVVDQGASLFWRLGESSGTTALDWAGSMRGIVGSGVTRGTAGAIAGDSNTATTFNGTANGRVSSPVAESAPAIYSASAWFRTTTGSGGKILGFGDSQTGSSTVYDRHVYMDNSGRIVYGVAPRGNVTIVSPNTYRNGQWHNVVSTLGPNGMRLYVDGVQVASRTDTVSGEDIFGYWRVGGDTLGSAWSNRPTSAFFNGAIDDVAVFPTVLTPAQISALYTSGRDGTGNNTPVAAFTSTTSALTANVNGTTSTDSDGTISSYQWTFGDGGTATGATASHTYASAGTFPVTLTVTDNGGASNSITKSVTVTAVNTPPTAAFTTSTAGLAVTVNGSTSSDAQGPIASYAWTFGDGGTATGATPPPHTYPEADTYNVTLTVTDGGGLTNSLTKSVTVAPAPNQPPTASFTATVNDLAVTVNGTASSDPEGPIAAYAWEFGDGGTATGATPPAHTYAAAGPYTVTLTVTDGDGATNVTTRSVTATEPGTVQPIAADAFGRTIANGWGTSDLGGAWTSNGTASQFSVNGSAGRITSVSTGNGPWQLLNINAAQYSGSVDIAMDKAPAGGGNHQGIFLRRVGTSDYRVKLRLMPTSTTLQITRVLNNAETTLTSQTVPALTYQVGDTVRVAFEISGTSPTTIRAKAWKLSGAEPAAFLATATDSSTALQVPGGFGIQAYLAGTNPPVVSIFDNLTIQSLPQ